MVTRFELDLSKQILSLVTISKDDANSTSGDQHPCVIEQFATCSRNRERLSSEGFSRHLQNKKQKTRKLKKKKKKKKKKGVCFVQFNTQEIQKFSPTLSSLCIQTCWTWI